MVASKVSMALWETSFNGLTLKVVPNSTQDSISLSIPSLASSISPSSTVVNIMSDKNNSSELSRDLVKAQREAKKAAKLAAKQKSKQKAQGGDSNPVEQVEQTSAAEPATSPKPKVDENKAAPSEQEKSKPVQPSNNAVKQPSNKPTAVENKENIKSETSKAQLKAERRAIQEQQRQAKAAAAQGGGKSKPNEKSAKSIKTEDKVKPASEKPLKPEVLKSKDSNATTIVNKKKIGESAGVKTAAATTLVHKVKLFNHLYRDNLSITQPSEVHPAIFRLGVQYATGVIRGSNARCVALLNGIKQMVFDYTTPSEKEYSRGFEERLGPAMTYLNKCRPHSISMLNAVKHFKSHLTQLPNDITDTQARLKLKEVIETYIDEQVDKAGEAICMFLNNKLGNDDVILTYGCSSLVEKVLVDAHKKGTKFRVIVVDGSPWFEGKEMLRRMIKHRIDCSYVLLSAVSYIMREVSKVIIGAHALLSNGAVMSRAGTAQVSLVARAFNVPVLAACETHKFCERVQTDSLVFNELGDPDEMISSKSSAAKNWKSLAHLTPLSLTYDITPSHLVTVDQTRSYTLMVDSHKMDFIT
uniref:Translation initiation factor eIF2B subunit delta n=2 Tax=Cacopsylla melanoneura TaxID=428564 RepID=A0A8D8Y4V4_9HEMI